MHMSEELDPNAPVEVEPERSPAPDAEENAEARFRRSVAAAVVGALLGGDLAWALDGKGSAIQVSAVVGAVCAFVLAHLV